MRILGHIVTDKNIKNIEPFIDQVKDLSEIDDKLPTLIVGWDCAKQHPLYRSIIDKQLSENLFWTFKRTESRFDFENDLEKFYSFVASRFLLVIKYYYINPFKLTTNRTKFLLSLVNSENGNNIYRYNGMLYFRYNCSTLGLSENICSYCGITDERLFGIIRRNNNNRVIDINEQLKKIISRRFNGNWYIIPYLNDD